MQFLKNTYKKDKYIVIILFISIILFATSTIFAWNQIYHYGYYMKWYGDLTTYDNTGLSDNWKGVSNYSAATWNASGMDYALAYSIYSDNDIFVYYDLYDGLAGQMIPISWLYGYWLECDIYLNSAHTDDTYGNTNPSAGYVDGQSICTHEFGHLLGLDHTAVAYATMLSSFPVLSIWGRTLESDDLTGINAIY